jgi:hypothetical protein
MNPIARRISQIEAELGRKNANHVDDATIRVMEELARRVRETALSPVTPGSEFMTDVRRAYAALLLPLSGQGVPSYDDGWVPGANYYRELARVIAKSGIEGAERVSAGITQCLDQDAEATVQALREADEQRTRAK